MNEGKILQFPDLLEEKCKYVPHRLHVHDCAMPEIVRRELMQSFVNVFKSVLGWVATDSAGGVYCIDIVQTGPHEYEYRAVLAESLTPNID